MIIKTHAYPRAALIGNPSDGYYGKTIAFTFPNYQADVTLFESPQLEILPARRDRFVSMMRLRFIAAAASILLCQLSAGAGEMPQGAIVPPLSAHTTLSQTLGTTPMFPRNPSFTALDLFVSYRSPSTPLFLALDFLTSSDGRYSVGGNFLDIPAYFRVRQAGLGVAGESLSARAGTFVHRDVVESPYSLFISSRDQSVFLYEIDYSGPWLRLLTRSVELNKNSPLGYPDRSVVFQTIALHGSRWEFGYQESTVAVPMPDSAGNQTSDGSGPVFVPEFFFSFIPSYLTQQILGDGQSPWLQRMNYNSLMGFFGRFHGELPAGFPWHVEAQILVDDFNANAIFNPDSPAQNPYIGAWMLSGVLDTPFGAFRLSQAGALAYTFQTSGAYRYSYTYYPEVAFPHNDAWQPFDYRDNYIGFYLGENTLAFRLDWDHVVPAPECLGETVAFDGVAEYTVSGSKSPINPWGDYDSWSDHPGAGETAFGSTRLLDEDVLEHGIRLGIAGSLARTVGPGTLKVRLATELGSWINVLHVDPVDRSEGFPASNDVELYRPSNEHFRLAKLLVGVSYEF